MRFVTPQQVLIGAGMLARAVEVGNPLVSWAHANQEGGIVVLDTGICFQFPGLVSAVSAHFSNDVGDLWPFFLMLEHEEVDGAGGTPTTWRVTANSNASCTSRGRPTRLQLSTPLPAKPGQCLGWYIAQPGSGVAYTDAAPYGQGWAHPDGKDKMVLSAVVDVSKEPAEGARLNFQKLHHRRYALKAEHQPDRNSFIGYATHLHQKPSQPASKGAFANCWRGMTPAMCCIPAGVGTPWCFDEFFTYERCCTPEAAGATGGWTPSATSMPERMRSQLQPKLVDDGVRAGQPSWRPDVSVDLFVRTYHAKMQELMHLLQSVAVFWPPSWGVIVVLDGESLEDERACAMLPKWIRCFLQPMPAFLKDFTPAFSSVDPFGHLGGTQRQRGLVWKEWTECWADKYSTAQFIAICDSDVVLTTFGLPQLMFQPADGASSTARAIIWGHADNAQFPNTVAALGLPLQAEFMDSFPLVINRRHFQSLRGHVGRLYGQEPKNYSSNEHFDLAFYRFLAKIGELSGGLECPSFHSMMGSVLWTYHRSEYVWSIRHGHLTGVALQHTCPRLRVAQHVAYWGKENWVTYAGLPETHLKVGGHPAVLSEVAYAARSTTLILAGLCAVQWMEFNASQFVSFAKSRQAFSFLLLDHGLRNPDAGLLEVQRDFCSHGLRLAEGRAELEERLLARTFPGQRWTATEALHCGSLQLENLLAEYHRLMQTIVFAVPQSHWKNVARFAGLLEKQLGHP